LKSRILIVGAGVSGIATARGLLRDGHDVTVFDQRPDVTAGGGAVTIWSNGATVLDQLGVDMTGAGQTLSAVRVTTASGHPLATVDLHTMATRLGAPIRMVPRRVLVERLLTGFPADRIQRRARVVAVTRTDDGVRVDLQDGSTVTGDVLIGADGLHSVVRDIVGAPAAKPTGWCSWQGLVTLPRISEPRVARMMIGEHGNLGLWPAGGTAMQWWFDLPWAPGFVRPQWPIETIRRHFTGWSGLVDEVLSTLTDDDLAPSPFPHFRHPIPPTGTGAVTLLGDGAVQGAGGGDGRRSRPAPVRGHPSPQGQSGVVGDHAAGIAQRGGAATRGARPGPGHDVGADPIHRLVEPPRHRR
jgi:FAD-dependent urate hydroxylase